MLLCLRARVVLQDSPECPHVISSPFNQAILVRVSWCAVGPAQWVLAASGPRPEHDVKLPKHGEYFLSYVRDDVVPYHGAAG